MNTSTSRTQVWSLLGLFVGATLLGCSSEDPEGEGGPGGPGSPNAPPPIVLPGGGSGSPGGGTDTPSGDLSPEAVKRLRDSACAGWSQEPELVPAVLELVVDVSNSMNNRAPGSDRGLTKWEATRDALLEAIVGVNGPGLSASTAVGLLFYPNRPNAAINERPGNVTGCVQTDALVPIATLGPAGGAHRSALERAFSDAVLNSSTPTHDAFRFALNQGLVPSRVPGSKYMLLITDGAPTLSLGCTNESGSLNEVDPRPIVEEVRAAAAQNIKTFLIGSPGSENNRGWMSEAARVGGTARANCRDNGPNYCHMDLTQSADFSEALRAGLADVAGQISSCSYEVPPPRPGETLDLSRVNVIFTGSGSEDSRLIGRSSNAECEEGWYLDAGKVTLCSETCEALQNDTGASLELLFGCETVASPVF